SYFYSFQIYCDFAGYSLIAIGMAKALGISSMKNFNFPYLAESLVEFWKRWHISLSKWLRDYIFLPLAYFISRKIKNDFLLGIKNETWSYVGGILVTMAICGIWHGSQWTFIIWGVLHGVYLAFSHFSRKLRRKALKKTGLVQKKMFLRVVRIFLTFNLVTFAWIFFRANSLSDAWYIITQICTGISFEKQQRFFAGFSLEDVLISLFFIGSLILYEYLKNFQIIPSIGKWSRSIRWATYYVVFLVILLLGFSQSKTFIYYNF
ncbi:MAG: MBOAT family O-acyltransferase, partial [Chrysiogenales bacterium]